MSRVEQVESQIAEFDAERWDRQFDDDARAGKLDGLAEEAPV
jgi:hypothetical protein